MKPIILVGSCKRNQEAGCLDVIRKTWARNSALPYKFFLGRGCSTTHPDELVFDVMDGYFEQNPKHQAALQWALDQGYTHVFLCDDDTFIHTKRLAASGFKDADYRGNMMGTPRPPDECGVEHDYCHGGCGYWLSAKAMRVIVKAEFDLSRADHRIDDQWFGLVLRDAGILPEHDPRYSMGNSYGKGEPPVLPTNDKISCHLSQTMGVYRPDWMSDAYRDSLKVLIACSSCWKDKDNGSNSAIRETWGSQLPLGWDLRFFLGGILPNEKFDVPMDSPGPGSIGPLSNDRAGTLIQTSPPLNDEVVLDVPDGYFYLPWKTTESLRWALERDYDFIFRIFTDTYVFPEQLKKSGFEEHDFVGRTFTCPPCKAHAKGHDAPHGGCGYWTSARAAKIVVDYPDKKEPVQGVNTPPVRDGAISHITHWGE